MLSSASELGNRNDVYTRRCGEMKIEMVRCWHPDSPGTTVIARRRWFKRRKFATLSEVGVYNAWLLALRGDTVDVRSAESFPEMILRRATS